PAGVHLRRAPLLSGTRCRLGSRRYSRLGGLRYRFFVIFAPLLLNLLPPVANVLMTKLDNPVLFLATANAERSRAFYERVLGFDFVADEPPALVFRIGDRMLRIQKVDCVQNAPYTTLGWAVGDIRQAACDLRAAGVVFQHYEGMNQDNDGIWQAPSGALVAWFRDPDGHVLSLTQFES